MELASRFVRRLKVFERQGGLLNVIRKRNP